MTITADINVQTGSSFGATEITAAIASAFNTISGIVDETIVENTSENLDAAAKEIAIKILEQSQSYKKRRSNDDSTLNTVPLISPEIRKILNNHKRTGYEVFTDIGQTLTEPWRSY